MNNEPKDPQPQKTPDQIGLWLAIGAGVGTLLGFVFNNIVIGVTMGAALGLVFGAALSLRTKSCAVFSLQPSNLPDTDKIDPCSKLV